MTRILNEVYWYYFIYKNVQSSPNRIFPSFLQNYCFCYISGEPNHSLEVISKPAISASPFFPLHFLSLYELWRNLTVHVEGITCKRLWGVNVRAWFWTKNLLEIMNLIWKFEKLFGAVMWNSLFFLPSF